MIADQPNGRVDRFDERACDPNAVRRPGRPPPLAADFFKSSTYAGRFTFDDSSGLVDLWRRYGWAPSAQDACFVPGYLGQRLAQGGSMVVTDRGDDRDERLEQ